VRTSYEVTGTGGQPARPECAETLPDRSPRAVAVATSGQVGAKSYPPAFGLTEPLGRQAAVVRGIHRRVIALTVPNELRKALGDFALAAARDRRLDWSDMLQALVAIGELCALHLTELQGDDAQGPFCLGCEFDFAPMRYRGQAEIPFPAGEAIDRRDLFSDEDLSDIPGFPQ
jgi:hypothetical protein